MSAFYQEGRYRGRITKQGIGEAKTGAPQFVLSFLIIGAYDGSELVDPPQKYERSMFRVINENTMPYLLEDLKKLGFSRDSFRFLDPASPNFHSFIGEEHDFYCKHETYNEKENEKWSLARDVGEMEIKPLATDKLRKLDALFGKQLRGNAAPTAAPQARATSTAVAEPPSMPFTDDDVPF